MRHVRVAMAAAWLQVSPVVRNWVFYLLMAMAPVLLIGVLGKRQSTDLNDMVMGYAVMVVINSALSQVSQAVAADRTYSFESWLRTLPTPMAPRLLGKALGVYATSVVSAVPLVVYSVLTHSVGLRAPLKIFFVTAAASLIFGLIGGIIGMLAKVETIQYVTNLAFVAISFLGGLFTGGSRMPFIPQWLYDWLPSTPPFQLVTHPSWSAAVRLAVLLLVLSLCAWLASRRASLRTYR